MADKKGITKYSGATRPGEGLNMEPVGTSRSLSFSVRTKLLGGFIMVALIGVITAYIGMGGIKDGKEAAEDISETHVPSISLLAGIRGGIWHTVVMQLTVANPLAPSDMRKEQYKKLEETFTKIDADWKTYGDIKKAEVLTSGETAQNTEGDLAKSFVTKYGEYKSKALALVEVSKQRDALLEAHALPGDARVAALDGKLWASYLEIRGIRGDLMKDTYALVETNVKDSHKTASFAAVDAEHHYRLILAIAIVGFILAVMLGYYLSREISGAVAAMLRAIDDVAKGDFTREAHILSRDEIGVMGDTFNGMVGELREMFKEIGGSSRTLATSADELAAVSSQLAVSSSQMSHQTDGVASATEQMSSNINSMAAAVEEASSNANSVSSTAEQMSANMHSIATSVEEMSQSIREVAQNTGETSKVAGEAMGLSKTASDTMQTLGAAANEIGKVTAMIKRIAEQTNLLALNATIEAASAGEAGKGFAVVANEIKELANQSARAAEEIAAKIEGVRGSAVSAVKVISDVSDIIGKINTSVENITGAMNQQTTAANEISRNVTEVSKGAGSIAISISEVAKGTTEVSRNSGEAARGVDDVLTNIQGISKSVLDNNAGISQINSSSGELAKMASSMQAMISRFKVESNGGGHKKIILSENAG